MSHTPGPWKVVEADWNEQGDVRYALEGVKHANAADAALIAAAPDLLEALTNMNQAVYMTLAVRGLADAWEKTGFPAEARAAIAKAQPASGGSKRRVG